MTTEVGSGGLSYYQRGATALYACQHDQRFSYCLYVPECYDEHGSELFDLLVAVHCTERDATGLRDDLIPFSEDQRCIVLAPLFPAGVGRVGQLHDYKFLSAGDVRYDVVLEAMIDEVAETWRVRSSSFSLMGFSGGGQFAHRFLLAHPARVDAASIAAPGIVTLCDPEQLWPRGVGGMVEELGVAFDAAAVAEVPVHLVVGEEDVNVGGIAVPLDSPNYIPMVNANGVTRVERVRSLAASFEANGNAVSLETVPGAAHEGRLLLRSMTRFLRDRLKERRESMIA